MSSSASTSSTSESAKSPSPPRSRQPPKRKRPNPADVSDSEHDSESDQGPALSHAERRRQKKTEREQKNLKSDSTPVTKKRKLKDGVAITLSVSKKEKRQNSVWVGNLSFRTTIDALRGFFDGVGEITRVHMPMKAGANDENMGFAYVDFASPDQKVIAISLSERDFQGRRLLIKDGDDFAGRPVNVTAKNADNVNTDDKTNPIKPSVSGSTGLSKTAQKILRIQKQAAAPTLFLGNLGFETTARSIQELFEAHRGLKKVKEPDDQIEKDEVKAGDKWIRKIRMGTFEDSGNCKGWAFIDFTSIEHATAALVNPKNHRLDGRNLVVEYASAEAVRRGGNRLKSKPEEGAGPRRGSSRGGRIGRGGGSERGRSTRGEGRGWNDSRIGQGGAVEPVIPKDEDIVPKTQDTGRPHAGADRGGYKGVKGRSKPGAALALAKRESAAIVASQGQKITF